MTVLASKKQQGDYQIRFILNRKKIIVTGKTLIDALKKVNQYKTIYL